MSYKEQVGKYFKKRCEDYIIIFHITWFEEIDSTEKELVDTRDCDVWFLAKIYDDKFLILFSNIDSEPDAMCDIFSLD